MRPITHATYQTMLNRIEMNIFDVLREIVFVPDRVLPKPSLPQCKLAIGPAFQARVRFD